MSDSGGGAFKDVIAALAANLKNTVLAALAVASGLLLAARRYEITEAKALPDLWVGVAYFVGVVCALVLLIEGILAAGRFIKERGGNVVEKRSEKSRTLRNLKHPDEQHSRVLAFIKRAGRQYFHAEHFRMLRDMKTLGLLELADPASIHNEVGAWKVPDAVWKEINKPDWAGNSMKLGDTPPWEPTSWRD